jgi:hypothetical protein
LRRRDEAQRPPVQVALDDPVVLPEPPPDLVALQDRSLPGRRRLVGDLKLALRWRVEPVTAQRGTDRGGRDVHVKPLEFPLDPLVAHRGFSLAKRMINCCTAWSSGSPGLSRAGPARLRRPRVPQPDRAVGAIGRH